MRSLTDLRRELHRFPELSGQEQETASRVEKWLEKTEPTRILSQIGGHGLAAIYDSGTPGETVLFRAELDALPIVETGTISHRSTVEDKAHLCGHDGHSAILLGLARHLHKHPPKRGRIVLLFQPAEETGAGARAVIEDPQFAAIKPDYSFSLHNLPGMALGSVGIKSGPFNFASEGLAIHLEGRTSHASHPEDAISPAQAISQLITALPALPESLGHLSDEALITVCHAQIGEAAFGITPGSAKLFATIRSITDDLQAKMMAKVKDYAKEIAQDHSLTIDFHQSEKFVACANDEDCAQAITRAAETLNIEMQQIDKPFRWSEDFGLFGGVSKSAMFVLGAGENCPQLHAPDYDFPDALIETGAQIFARIADNYCR